MSVIGVNPTNYNQGFPQVNNYPPKMGQTQGAVAITTPQGKQIYNYPQTSIYNEPNKQSGLNIYVFNPSGIGAPSTINNINGTQSPAASTPIANTPISGEKSGTNAPKKTKNVVKLTNDYIKTLEGFLKSPDESVRKQGVQDLISRFEEDKTRYDNPALTALLNIALQDPDVHNRIMAESLISSGNAHGDENTIELLRVLVNSDKMYGQEAKLASQALLNTSKTKEKIVDDNSEIKETDTKNENEIT